MFMSHKALEDEGNARTQRKYKEKQGKQLLTLQEIALEALDNPQIWFD